MEGSVCLKRLSLVMFVCFVLLPWLDSRSVRIFHGLLGLVVFGNF